MFLEIILTKIFKVLSLEEKVIIYSVIPENVGSAEHPLAPPGAALGVLSTP